MTATRNKAFDKVFRQLENIGFLLVSGTEIPDVRSLITGKKSKGSWWSDPAAHQIFAVNGLLEDHPDVVVTKLISKKVTFVHRRFWSELFTIATSHELWQMDGLSTSGKVLLKEIDQSGEISTLNRKLGDVARELEQRLLIHSTQVHTESGAHAKVLESWQRWTTRARFKPRQLEVSTARETFEKRVQHVNEQYECSGHLPWQRN